MGGSGDDARRYPGRDGQSRLARGGQLIRTKEEQYSPPSGRAPLAYQIGSQDSERDEQDYFEAHPEAMFGATPNGTPRGNERRDEEREDEDEHGGHDGLYILTIQVVLLPGSSAADCCHKTPSECGVWTHDPVQ